MVLDANTVRTVLGMLQGPKIDNDAWVHDIGIEEDDEGIHITVTVGADERPNVPIAEAKQDIYTRLGARPDAVVHISLNQPPIRRIVARVAAVPGYGWQPFAPAPLAHPVEAQQPDGTVVLSNGLLTVEVDAALGTFSLNGRPGYGRLVDGGDLGDSYNYSPPRRDTLIETPVSVSVRVVEPGPVRARAAITAVYVWPDHVDGSSQERVGEHRVEVETLLELRADEPAPAGGHVVREPEPRPPGAGAPPPARAGAYVPGGERLRRRRAGADGGGACRRVRPADRPGGPVRLRRGTDRGP